MKKINEENYELSTGKIISPNRGIIGICHEENEYAIYEGYDGMYTTESEIENKDWLDKSNIDLTNVEVKELAIYMSDLWGALAKSLDEPKQLKHDAVLEVVCEEIYVTCDPDDGSVYCGFDDRERAELERDESGCELRTLKVHRGKRK